MPIVLLAVYLDTGEHFLVRHELGRVLTHVKLALEDFAATRVVARARPLDIERLNATANLDGLSKLGWLNYFHGLGSVFGGGKLRGACIDRLPLIASLKVEELARKDFLALFDDHGDHFLLFKVELLLTFSPSGDLLLRENDALLDV